MRAILRLVHRYLGLLLVLPMLVQGVTGAVLTFEPMLHETGSPRALGGSSAAPAAISIDAMVNAAHAVAPGGTTATRYVPPGAASPAEVWFAPPQGGPGGRGVSIVRVDPRTLTPILPVEARDGPLDWMRRVHTNFLLQDYGGRSIVGWAGVGLLLLSVIGIPIWWPTSGQWRAAFTVSPNARGMVFHRRLHGAVGIWVVLFLLVSSASGAILGFPQTIRGALGIQAAGRGGAGGGPGGGNRAASDAGATVVQGLDAAVALASTAAPGTALRMVMPPQAAGAPIRVFLAPPGSEGVARMTTVTVDGKATRVMSVQDPATMAGAELSLRWVHDIHFGQGLGVIWRLLTILTGLALPVFAVTGTAMWWLRNRNRKRAVFARRGILSPGE